MDPPGGQLDESLTPRVITSPPPTENPTGLEAPPASANSSLSTTQPPLPDRGADSILDHTGEDRGEQHLPEQHLGQQQLDQEPRDDQDSALEAVDDSLDSQQLPSSGATNPGAFDTGAWDVSSSRTGMAPSLDTILRAVHVVRQPLYGDVAAATLYSGMEIRF